jgi:hypothetical protein
MILTLCKHDMVFLIHSTWSTCINNVSHYLVYNDSKYIKPQRNAVLPLQPNCVVVDVEHKFCANMT